VGGFYLTNTVATAFRAVLHRNFWQNQQVGRRNGMNKKISINMENLNARASELRGDGQSFLEENQQALTSVDNRSTISVITNSVAKFEEMVQAHQAFGNNLVASAEIITNVGEGFFELDTTTATSMKRENVGSKVAAR